MANHVFAQSTTEVTGTVTDVRNNDPLPFVNVYFKGSNEGTITDENGYFEMRATYHYDTVVFSSVGYKQIFMPVKPGEKHNVSIQLESELVNLDEVIVMSGENPAWEIIRNAVKNKKLHDKRKLKAYEYNNYSRIEIDVENISTKLSNRKLVKDIWAGIDTALLEKNDKGNAVLPLFLSESYSRYYVKNDPFARREEVKKTKVSGAGVEDGSLISQMVGSAYQDYNFYQNWLRFLEKEFVSPLADSWKTFYDYEIRDTLYVGNDLCYELDLFPHRVEDPAFNGKIWITTSGFALKKMDVFIGKATNLNFIDKIEISQELVKTRTGHWLPSNTRIKVDVENFGKKMVSFWIKSNSSTSDWKVNDEKDKKFYINEVQVAEDFKDHTDEFWQQVRPPTLTDYELNTYVVLDTIREMPKVRSLTNMIKLVASGYWKRGKVNIGPYLYAYAYNNFEGHSFRLGAKTNDEFSRKIALRGYLGYGTTDKNWKYGFTGKYIIKRKPWTVFGMHSSHDLERLGIRSDDLIDDNYIFYAATRWQTYRRPYFITRNNISMQSEVSKGLTHKITLLHEYYNPQFPFYYYEHPGSDEMTLKSDISAPAIKFSTRWGRDEMFVQSGNTRVSLGPRRSPIIQFDYTYGFKDVFDGDFDFHKLQLQFTHKLRLGSVGETRYRLRGGYIFGQVPYLLLENHIGNESIFFTNGAFNTMNYFEFVSDKYATLRMEHHFHGLLMNKIPLIRKLKWRLLATANVLYGSLRQENIDIISPVDPEGNPTPGFNSLDDKEPFIEVGYGIENIFKVIRIDGVHRITYRDNPGAQKFALKFSFQFNL